MEDLLKIRKFYELKKVYRMNTVENRKESSAEHTYSCLILADYLLSSLKLKLDKIKVYELVLYHDVVEIEAGDIPIHHLEKKKNKKENELKALHSLKDKIPKLLKSKFVNLFLEFEEQKTREAKFAKAVDKLDAIIHELDYKKDWKGWSEKFYRSLNDEPFIQFPELKNAYETINDFARKNSYFDD